MSLILHNPYLSLNLSFIRLSVVFPSFQAFTTVRKHEGIISLIYISPNQQLRLLGSRGV